jgi:hypothetical protein
MKFIFTFILSVCLLFSINAQAPQGINYQGIARNAQGVELTNQLIGIELSVLNGSANGTVVYTEQHSVTTDAGGLFTLTIGLGTPTIGNFTAINWAVGGGKWLKVSMDANGGTNFQLLGTSQLLSVPFALYAGNVANNGGKQTLVLSDDVTDAEALGIIAAEVGPNTQEIRIVGTTNLTTVDLSMITTAIDIQIANNTALTNVNLSGLTRCDGDLTFTNSPNLSNINLASLAKITAGNFELDGIGITTLNIPSLVKMNASLVIDDNPNLTSINMSGISYSLGLYITDNPILSSVSFSALTSSNGSLEITNNASLNSINLASLTSCLGGIYILSNQNNLTSINLNALTVANIVTISSSSLTTLSLPALLSSAFNISNTSLQTLMLPSLTSLMGFSVNSNSLLTTISLPSLSGIPSAANNFNAEGNKLSVINVNYLLNKLVSISPALTSKNIYLGAQNPPAPPSGQGITDKNTLIANGNYVSTD